MDAVEDESQRALLADTLLAETKPPEESEVQSADSGDSRAGHRATSA